MWMTREEIAAAMGIVPNSVRGKVQKGQIERKVEGGKNYYRIGGFRRVTREGSSNCRFLSLLLRRDPFKRLRSPDRRHRARSTPNRSSWINWYLLKWGEASMPSRKVMK